MISALNQSWFRKAVAILALWMISVSFVPSALADAKEDAVNAMKGRQQAIEDSFAQLDFRVNNFDANDPRKKRADELLNEAKDAKNKFVDMDAANNLNDQNQPNDDFLANEKAAIEKINSVNRYLSAPVQPGASKVGETGTVPGSGTQTATLTEAFIPNLIRLLFRFTSLMILVSFVASGAMLIIAYDNTEYVDKAKRMLYYSLIGFAFVTLAYAIVKGITQVNYFGIV